MINKKLTAYQCWKEKESKKLSDEEFKQLLIKNGIIMSKSEDLKDSFYANMKSAVLGTMLKKGVDEITQNCIDIAENYKNQCLEAFAEDVKENATAKVVYDDFDGTRDAVINKSSIDEIKQKHIDKL